MSLRDETVPRRAALLAERRREHALSREVGEELTSGEAGEPAARPRAHAFDLGQIARQAALPNTGPRQNDAKTSTTSPSSKRRA